MSVTLGTSTLKGHWKGKHGPGHAQGASQVGLNKGPDVFPKCSHLNSSVTRSVIIKHHIHVEPLSRSAAWMKQIHCNYHCAPSMSDQRWDVSINLPTCHSNKWLTNPERRVLCRAEKKHKCGVLTHQMCNSFPLCLGKFCCGLQSEWTMVKSVNCDIGLQWSFYNLLR